MSQDHPEQNSNIPEVRLPDGGFQSDIPESLLHEMSEKDRYLYETLGQMKDFIKWSAPIIVDSNRQARKTNGRVNKNEDDINILESQIKSWISFKESFVKVIKSKYFIIGGAIVIFLCLYPLAIYVSKSGGVIQFAQSIVKAIWG